MKKIAKFDDLMMRARSGEDIKLKEHGVNPTLYWAYQKSLDLKHRYLNFNDAIWDNQIPEIVQQLREAGKKKFTISSTYSGMTETIHEFIKNGCRLSGMTTVKTYTTNWETGENDIIPAFVLTIKE
ncbi:MAG: hypothetical protein IK093_16540 [Ruminiclostridium sp.]|nr:hypothetical protein [Ruminiclostridium sp.]